MLQRFYEKVYPEVGDIVMTQYTMVDDIVIRVVLPEFGNIEGTIAHSEISRKKITFVERQIKINSLQPAIVLYINTEKGYIDLSKKIISHEQDQTCRETFRNSKFVNSILEGISRNYNVDISDLYKFYIWPIEKSLGQDNTSIYTILLNNLENIDKSLYGKFLPIIEQEFKRKINLREIVKLTMIIRVNCFTIDGIDSVKQALFKGRVDDVKISLLKSPYYCLTLSTNDKDSGNKKLHNSASLIQREIISLGGDFELLKTLQSDKDTKDLDIALPESDSDE